MENRFNMLLKSDPEQARMLFAGAQHDAEMRFRMYDYLASFKAPADVPA